MTKKTAGVLVYRIRNREPEFLLAHPGGPFWAKKDLEAWSIPKGEFDDTEDPLSAAKREFEEEMGSAVTGQFVPLKPLKSSSGKIIYAYAVESEFDVSTVTSNTFPLEWPPKSGKIQHFPEVDRAAWFPMREAAEKINTSQAPFLQEVKEMLERIKC
ncbi:MAG TPA: NUDIX domain-containing protein [Ohtaekwangia sp.]